MSRKNISISLENRLAAPVIIETWVVSPPNNNHHLLHNDQLSALNEEIFDFFFRDKIFR